MSGAFSISDHEELLKALVRTQSSQTAMLLRLLEAEKEIQTLRNRLESLERGSSSSKRFAVSERFDVDTSRRRPARTAPKSQKYWGVSSRKIREIDPVNVLEVFRGGDPLSAKEAASKIPNVDRWAVRQRILELCHTGSLERLGRARGTKYRLADKAKTKERFLRPLDPDQVDVPARVKMYLEHGPEAAARLLGITPTTLERSVREFRRQVFPDMERSTFLREGPYLLGLPSRET